MFRCIQTDVSRQQTKVGIRALKDIDGECVTDKKKMAELLNDHFHSVFTVDNILDNPFFENRTDTICLDNPEVLFQIKDIKKSD